jgi:hypothetical protein
MYFGQASIDETGFEAHPGEVHIVELVGLWAVIALLLALVVGAAVVFLLIVGYWIGVAGLAIAGLVNMVRGWFGRGPLEWRKPWTVASKQSDRIHYTLDGPLATASRNPPR